MRKEKKDEMYRYPKDESKVDNVNFKIIVPTEEDKQKLIKAFRYLHYCDIDTEYVWVNQLVHSYLEDSRAIIVEDELFEVLNE